MTNHPNNQPLTAKQEAQSEDTTIERLRELALKNIKLAYLVAQNQTASSQLLEEIFNKYPKSKKIKQYIIKNPNTSTDILIELSSTYIEELLENPIFDFLLLENPYFLDQLSDQAFETILLKPDISEFFLHWAAKRNDQELLLYYLTNHPKLSQELIDTLANSQYPSVQIAAKLHINYSQELSTTVEEIVELALTQTIMRLGFRKINASYNTEKYIINKKWFINYLIQNNLLEKTINASFWDISWRNEIASHSKTPPAILDQLAHHPYYNVDIALILNSNTPITTLETIRKKGSSQTTLAEDKNTPPEILIKMVKNPDPKILRAILSNPNITLEIVKELSQNQDITIHNIVIEHEQAPSDWLDQIKKAKNPNNSISELHQLATHPNLWIRFYVAKNPNTPAEILKILAQDQILIKQEVAKNPNTPTEILEQFNDNKELNYYLSLNPELPTSIINKIIIDIIIDIINKIIIDNTCSESIIKNFLDLSKLSPQNLEQLSQSQNQAIKVLIAEHPNTPTQTLAKLAFDSDQEVRICIAKNPNTPSSTLVDMLTDSDPEILYTLLSHPNLPIESLEKLFDDIVIKKTPPDSIAKEFDDKTLKVSLGLSKNPNTPLHILEHLATLEHINYQNNELYIKCNIAQHPHTSTSILDKLSTDKRQAVIRAIVENPNTPTSIILKFIKYRNFSLHETIKNHPNTPKEIKDKFDLANDPTTPSIQLEKLANEPNIWIQYYLVNNPQTPIHILEKIATNPNYFSNKEIKEALAKNPNTPPNILEKLLHHPDDTLYELTLKNPQISHGILPAYQQLEYDTISTDKLDLTPLGFQLIANNPKENRRISIAQHPHIPIELLEKLAQDPCAQVRAKVANHHRATNSILQQLSLDQERCVIINLCSNFITPFPIIQKILSDWSSDKEIYQLAHQHSSSPLEMHHKLFNFYAQQNDQPSGYRFLVFLSSTAAPALLAQNYNSLEWLERYAIAQNPRTPPEILQLMTQDTNQVVRIVAQKTLDKKC